jgi:YggT family protein
MIVIVQIIRYAITILTWLVIADVVLSYFMSPFHPVRETLDRLIEPMLAPIRRVMPNTGMVDFSPLVLIIVLQLIQYILVRMLLAV